MNEISYDRFLELPFFLSLSFCLSLIKLPIEALTPHVNVGAVYVNFSGIQINGFFFFLNFFHQ